jgi:choline dehydrogenase-like flavoprotein
MIVDDINQVANKTFDYIICGGGTAGVTVAARLSEKLPSATILVLEAGGDNEKHPDVLNPRYGTAFTNPDLCWQSPEGATSPNWIRGKGLGGSSTINFMFWSVPPKEDLDDFERLGNPGWNWNLFQPHFRALEGYNSVNEVDMPFGLTVDSAIGKDGPVKLSCLSSPSKDFNLVQDSLIRTLNEINIHPASRPYDGSPSGSFLLAHTIEPETKQRFCAGRVFTNSIRYGQGVYVLVNALVNQLNWSDENGLLRSTGVEFEYAGRSCKSFAAREVIICSGALRSPQILELSGIGDPNVLGKLGIPVRKSLKGVGSNLQDHTILRLLYGRDPIITKEDKGEDKTVVAAQIGTFLNLKDVITKEFDDFMSQTEHYIESKRDNLEPDVSRAYDILLDRLKRGSPGFELVLIDGSRFSKSSQTNLESSIQVTAILNHCWSRGSVHSISTSARDQPAIAPNFFESPIDSKLFGTFLRFVRKLMNLEPLKSTAAVTGQYIPNSDLQTDEELGMWAETHAQTAWHASCSCAMLPESYNGVVDTQLKVYGTQNVRIADISVMPIQVASHMQAIAYAIGCIAAEIVETAEL